MTKVQLRVEKRTPGYWRATFDHPPINLIDPGTIHELDALVSELESDPEVRVVVFDSADRDFFLAHYDLLVDKAANAAMKPGRTGLHPWLDVLFRLSTAPAVSLASIRGRARGAGSEFVLACDMRFGSRERCILGQFEVGLGAVPGGGPMARLARLVGRARALEIVAGAEDFDAELAAQYGYLNRALADHELDAFVEAFARRLSGFDKQAIAEVKRLIDGPTLPAFSEFDAGIKAYLTSTTRSETRKRIESALGAGLQQRGEVELNLGRYVGEAARGR
ncbi:MAG TPA: enoyl-CoA hydratase/isomerase family protein [Polyangiaceae bacterium]